MAISTGYNYGIRQGLVGKGVNNSDIGYDQNSGYVTVKGANAIKAPKTYMGTSYTSQNDFNNDWNTYQKSLNQPQPGLGAVAGFGNMVADTAKQQPTSTTTQQSAPTQQYNPYQSSNPYDTQVNDMISRLLQQANNQQPIDVNAIYKSPQYAAYQAQAQRGADQGIRAAQEAMGTSGFGRSTALQERSQGIQNDATQYMNTQVLPQLMAQEQQSRQQQFQNQFSALDALLGQQTVGDNRFNTANNLAIDKSSVTGNYLDPQAMKLIDEITQLGEAWKTGTPEEKVKFNQQANQNRSLLAAMGIDPSLFGADKTTEERIANSSKAGVRTIQGQQLDRANFESDRDFEFAKSQQEWSNMFNTQQFEESKAARVWEQAFQEKNFAQDMKEAAASRGLQWASLGQRQKEYIADSAFREKQFQYEQEQDILKNSPTSQKAEDYFSYIDSSPTAFTKDEDGLPVQNDNTIESMILGSGLSESEMKKLYLRYGIPMN